jgi:hypothetical protein
VTSDRFGEILLHFIAGCDTYRLAEPLGFLEPTGVLATPDDPVALVAALAASFHVDELRGAGIVVESDGGLALLPVLARPGEPFIVLRRPGEETPFGLVTAAGLLTSEGLGGGLAAVAAIEDRVYAAATQPEGAAVPPPDGRTLYVAFTAADAAVLRACGLPAVPSSGLEEPRPGDVDSFCAAFGFSRSRSARIDCRDRREEEEAEWQAEEARTADEKARKAAAQAASGAVAEDPAGGPRTRQPDAVQPEAVEAEVASAEVMEQEEEEDGWIEIEEATHARLRLVAWSPATLDLSDPAGFDMFVGRLLQTADLLRINLYEVSVWKPEVADLERLEYFCRHRDPSGFAESLADSAFDASTLWRKFLDRAAAAGGAAEDFAVAAGRLRSEVRPALVGYGRADGTPVGEVYADHVEQHVVDLLRRAALESPPLERALLLSLAELVGVNLLQAGGVAVSLRGSLVSGVTAGVPTDGRFEQYMASAGAIVSLAREVARCREPGHHKIIHVASSPGGTPATPGTRRPALPPPHWTGSD